VSDTTGADALREKLNGSATYVAKPPATREVIFQAVEALSALGVPTQPLTGRRLERMALAFLAVAKVTSAEGWSSTQHLGSGHRLTTREIIDFLNEHFHENISRGSYDDIRRKDLQLPVMAGIIVSATPEANKNNPTRRYAVDSGYAQVVRTYGTAAWSGLVQETVAERGSLAERTSVVKSLPRTEVIFPSGEVLEFGPGTHNLLIKSVIEEFLPRFGHEAQVYYVGDADRRLLVYEKERLSSLGFFELGAGELPDVVAYSQRRNWLFLIEAVATSGPVSAIRHLKLKALTENCAADIVYVTAFNDRVAMRKHLSEIAWETEVWIATEPDHMIHFDGDKFLGPYAR
jgi:hypothetical protein